MVIIMKTLGISFKNELRIAIEMQNEISTFGTLRVTGDPVKDYVPFEFITDNGLILKPSTEEGVLEFNNQYISVINEANEGYMVIYGIK